jgi:CrcB protein
LELQRVFLVGFGGAIGSILRYLVAKASGQSLTGIPYHTLIVNLAGCFLIGLVSVVLPFSEENQSTRIFLITGILGGFTTFSAFGFETFDLIRTGASLVAASYVLVSVIFGLVGVALGSLAGAYLK